MWAFFFFVTCHLFVFSRSLRVGCAQQPASIVERSVTERSRSVSCHPFGIHHYCRVLPRAHTRVYVYITPSELMFSCLLLVALREIKQITTNQPEYSIRMV